MHLQIRKWAALSFMVVLCLTLAACNASTGSSNNNSPKQTAASNPTTAAKKDPITLRIAWFGSQSRTDATLKALEAYTKKNPHVTFSPEYVGQNQQYIDKLSTQAAGKNTPDIFTMDLLWLDGFASRNQLADLSEGVNIADIDPALIEESKYKGKLYGIPLATNAIGMVYNKAKLAELGIPEPAADWTWDDYFQFGYDVQAKLPAGKYALKDESPEMGIFTAYQYSQGKGETLSRDGVFNFDRQSFLEIMYKYKELREAGVVPPAEITVTNKDADVALDAVLNGTAIMRRGFSSTIGAYEAVHPNTYSLVPFPRASEPGSHVKISSLWSVSPNTKHMDEVKKFLDWWVNDQEANSILTTVRGFPTSSKMLDHITPLLSVIDKVGLDLVKTVSADPAPYSATPDGWSAFVQKDYVRVVQEIMFGQKTPEEGYDELVKLAQGYIK